MGDAKLREHVAKVEVDRPWRHAKDLRDPFIIASSLWLLVTAQRMKEYPADQPDLDTGREGQMHSVELPEVRARRSAMKDRIADHPVAAFLFILYPVTWILYLPEVLGKSGMGLIPVDIPAQVGVLLSTIFALTGVAFLATRLANGKPGTAALRRHYYQFRARPYWYLLAVFAAPVILLIVAFALHGSRALNPMGRNASQIPTNYLLNLVLIAVLISVWEEGGWMAFMTARLQRRWGPLVASIVLAPCFGFVHFPLFLVTGGLIDNARPQGGQVLEYAFYLLVLFSVPVRILITWVYNSTRGSLPVVALLHASIDTTASTAVLVAFYPAVDGRLLYVGIAGLAAVLVLVTRGRLGYRAEPQAAAGLVK